MISGYIGSNVQCGLEGHHGEARDPAADTQGEHKDRLQKLAPEEVFRQFCVKGPQALNKIRQVINVEAIMSGAQVCPTMYAYSTRYAF
jgi:hypothetical protein